MVEKKVTSGTEEGWRDAKYAVSLTLRAACARDEASAEWS